MVDRRACARRGRRSTACEVLVICDYASLPLPDQIKANQATVCAALGIECVSFLRWLESCHGPRTVIGKAARLELARREALS